MTLANTFAAKLSVALVAVAMLFTMVAPAQAATAEELQAQIDALMAQISSLSGSTPTASADAYVFTRSLTVGSQGADVTALQNYLIGAGHAIPAGATGYFGSQTQSAVAAWQAANMISPAAGYFGPVSQAKYNELMAAGSDDDSDDDSSDDDANDDDDSSSDELSGEASLGDTDLKDGDDTDIEEGQEAAPVADFEVQFDNGDAVISRIDVELTATGEEDGWDTFEEVSLWVDGDEVGSIDASDEDNWLSDEATLRFTGLDIVAMEDEDVTVTIAVSVAGSVDNLDANWDVDVTGLRFTDADDVTSTEDDASVGVTATDFDISVEGSDDEVIVKSSASDPEATTLQLDESDKSDYMTIFAFDIDTDDSTNDVEVNEIVVDVDSTENGTLATTTNLLINDAMLVVDGEEFDDVTVTVSGSRFTFDIDGDLVIEAGDRVAVEFQAEFLALDSSLEGATVQGEFVSIDAEGAADITATGAAQGEEHTLRTVGAILEAGDMSETKDVNSDTTTNDDEGIFVIEFEVTAFEADLYVNKTAASGTTMGTAGVNYQVTNGSGSLVGTTTPSASLSSTADTDGTRYVVNEGETETFTLTVTYDPGTGGFYGIRLYSFNYAVSNANPTEQQVAEPLADYETDPLSI